MLEEVYWEPQPWIYLDHMHLKNDNCVFPISQEGSSIDYSFYFSMDFTEYLLSVEI